MYHTQNLGRISVQSSYQQDLGLQGVQCVLEKLSGVYCTWCAVCIVQRIQCVLIKVCCLYCPRCAVCIVHSDQQHPALTKWTLMSNPSKYIFLNYKTLDKFITLRVNMLCFFLMYFVYYTRCAVCIVHLADQQIVALSNTILISSLI